MQRSVIASSRAALATIHRLAWKVVKSTLTGAWQDKSVLKDDVVDANAQGVAQAAGRWDGRPPRCPDEVFA